MADGISLPRIASSIVACQYIYTSLMLGITLSLRITCILCRQKVKKPLRNEHPCIYDVNRLFRRLDFYIKEGRENTYQD